MAIRFAVVGPGRVGQALGARLQQAGAELLGFVGRRPGSAAAAVRFCGHGRELALADLATAHVVVFAVGDDDLAPAIAAAAAVPPRSCSLWLHTSGCRDLTVFAPLQGRGARIGALHPAVPIPDPATGLRHLAGRPAVLLGPPESLRLLRRLCELLGMVPLHDRGGDRALYHAACVLAANGTTALLGAVDDVLAAAGGLDAADRRELAQALASAAVQASGERGPAAALSGPVVRGDHATVRGHADALGRALPALLPLYRALQRQALRLAEQRGLPAAAAARLRETLGGDGA